MFARNTLALAVLSLSGLAVQAADLMAMWRAAARHDPQAAIAEAERLTGDARRAQAKALWRPSVMLNAGAGVASSDTRMSGAQFSAPGFGQSEGVAFGTSVHAGASTRWGVQARQSLWNPERTAQEKQLGIAAQASERLIHIG